MKYNKEHDNVAQTYEKIRPSYPKMLIKDLFEACEISSTDTLLEIGAGTGKATRQIAKSGNSIDCIELGSNLASILEEKCKAFPNVNVEVQSFEKWVPSQGKTYDVVYSAQAFHWIDENIKYKKCHQLLKDQGSLALFWYQPLEAQGVLAKNIKNIFLKHIPHYYDDQVDTVTPAENIQIRHHEIAESGLFTNIQTFQYLVKNQLSAAAYIDALKSYSKFVKQDNRVQKAIISEIITQIENTGDGYVQSDLQYYMFTARKI